MTGTRAASPTRCGFVALIGEPNAGKSTLLNRMVGAKVSIVTHKVQTTRARIRGIAIEGAAQLVFVDTPGLFRPRRRLDRAMVKAAWGGAADADVVVLLIEAHRGLTEGVRAILEALAAQLPPARDGGARHQQDRPGAGGDGCWRLSAEMNAARDFAATFMISAERGHGVEDLRRWLAGRMPEGPWLYPEDQIADLPLRLIAAETTREKLTLRLHQELPYELTVETEGWEERKDGSVRIDQVVYVARDGHKGIALGPKGATIKAVGQAARAEIEAFLGREVHLFLTVKVRPNWLEERERYRRDRARLPGRRRLSVTAPRLTAEFWVQAYLARLRLADIPAFVTARGDATAGAVIVKLNTLDGQARAFARSYDAAGRAGLGRARPTGRRRRWTRRWRGSGGYDPDLWVIEVEDRAGRSLLDEPGLAG